MKKFFEVIFNVLGISSVFLFLIVCCNYSLFNQQPNNMNLLTIIWGMLMFLNKEKFF